MLQVTRKTCRIEFVGKSHLHSEPTERKLVCGNGEPDNGNRFLILRNAMTANPPKSPPPVVPEVRTVDSKARLVLPKGFANATVMFEAISETEILIRKAVVIAEASLPTIEDTLQPLSNRDRDIFLNLIDNPPAPNAAFRKAAKRYKARHGRNPV